MANTLKILFVAICYLSFSLYGDVFWHGIAVGVSKNKIDKENEIEINTNVCAGVLYSPPKNNNTLSSEKFFNKKKIKNANDNSFYKALALFIKNGNGRNIQPADQNLKLYKHFRNFDIQLPGNQYLNARVCNYFKIGLRKHQTILSILDSRDCVSFLIFHLQKYLVSSTINNKGISSSHKRKSQKIYSNSFFIGINNKGNIAYNFKCGIALPLFNCDTIRQIELYNIGTSCSGLHNSKYPRLKSGNSVQVITQTEIMINNNRIVFSDNEFLFLKRKTINNENMIL